MPCKRAGRQRPVWRLNAQGRTSEIAEIAGPAAQTQIEAGVFSGGVEEGFPIVPKEVRVREDEVVDGQLDEFVQRHAPLNWSLRGWQVRQARGIRCQVNLGAPPLQAPQDYAPADKRRGADFYLDALGRKEGRPARRFLAVDDQFADSHLENERAECEATQLNPSAGDVFEAANHALLEPVAEPRGAQDDVCCARKRHQRAGGVYRHPHRMPSSRGSAALAHGVRKSETQPGGSTLIPLPTATSACQFSVGSGSRESGPRLGKAAGAPPYLAG